MKLKFWVQTILIIECIIAFMSFGLDMNNYALFVISKVVALFIILKNAVVLNKFGF